MNKKIETIILAIMCFVLTAGMVVQINSVNSNGTTVTGNQTESNLKSQVLKMKERYENQYAELEKAEKELEQARQQATSSNTELEELENQIKQYNLLLGNTDVTGEGIMVTLTDGQTDLQLLDAQSLIVHAENVLSVVNELKNAGAEAISINGQRIVNTTAISCDGNVIVVNGEKISSPIQISAIGLPELLSTLDRPGGILENFGTLGKIVELRKSTNLEIPKYAGVITFRYAKTIR